MSDQLTVFVVDDDFAAAASVAALVMSVGLKVETYHSAEEFLAASDVSRDGCLVLDVRLPGMNGLELQESLAGMGSKLPIILISGHADQAVSDMALERGAVAFFEKPFDGNALCDVIRAALARR